MAKLLGFFVSDYKRFICKRNLIVIVLIVILSMYAVHIGADGYKKTQYISKEFQKAELLIFEKMSNYTLYSNVGIRIFFIPSASWIFFTNPSVLADVSARINTIATLDLYTNCISGNLFQDNSFLSLKFSNIVLLIGIMAAIFLGYTPIRDKEYLKSLSSCSSHLKVYLSVIISRIVLFTLSFIVISGLMLGLTALEGIKLTRADFYTFSGFMLQAFFLVVFFFLLGTIAAIIPSRGKSFLAILSVLFVFFIIIPAVKSAIIEKTVEGLPSAFKLYSDKIKIVNDFETRTIKEKGEFKNNTTESAREIIEGYWNKESKEIMALENDILNRFSRVVEINNSLSLITPVEVYHSTCHSASSRGYENFLEFFKYLIQLRRDFLRFWLDRSYYNDPKILVSFVKGDENLFHAIPRLPGNFLSGVLANLAWTVLLIIAGYILFEKYLYTPENKNPLKEKELEFKLRKNKINTLSSRKTIIRDKLYLYFSGQTGKNKYSEPNLRLIHGDQPLTVPTNNKGFVYICDPCEISGDIKVKDFISFVCKSNGVSRTEISGIIKSLSPDTPVNEYLRKLEPEQRADVLLSVIPYIKGSVYVVDDMYRYLTLPIMIKLKDQLDALVKRGALVIYLAKENRIDPNRADRDIEVINLPEWFDVIEANRFQLRNGGGELKK